MIKLKLLEDADIKKVREKAFQYKNKQKFGLAIRTFQKIVRKYSGTRDALIAEEMVGVCQFSAGDFQKAVTTMRRAAKKSKKSYLARSVLGSALMSLKRYEAAIPVFVEAVALKADPGIMNFLVRCYIEVGNESARKRMLDRAVRVDPKYEETQFNLGGYWHERKEYKNAESRYRKAIALDPKYKIAHYYLGKLLVETGRIPEGQRLINRSSRLKPV